VNILEHNTKEMMEAFQHQLKEIREMKSYNTSKEKETQKDEED
jgi:hypothetical protein